MTVGIGLIGFGPWGEVLYKEVGNHPAFSIAAIYDRNREHQLKLQEQGLGHMLTESADALISHRKVDMVMVATQVTEHANLVFKSLQAGRHVWVEKPICEHRDEANAMRKLAKKEQRVLFVDHTQLYCPAFDRIRQMVRGGELGRIRQVRTWRANFGRFAKDSDVLGQLLYHDIYLVQALFPQVELLRLSSSGSDLMIHGQWDTVNCSVMLANGVMVDMMASLTHPEKARSMSIMGEKGALVWEDSPNSEVRLYRHKVERHDYGEALTVTLDKEPLCIDPPSTPTPLQRALDHMLSSIHRGEQPESSVPEAVEVLNWMRRIRGICAHSGF
ncbi:oxidoreductase domain protein [Magnetococcus marinus MC-1]|uniref:Oxidoreductase domain protein n=1 Tax=Magnetococcus marinus (strain ATCC BAA-1437 / JCM 17883 / MC-1) TaxID=156889 RepID=A0L7R0_MAGMM|nr:Gfo/Idh/MocA family oxidoreductase [Magnetococcus marinus]ABK44003.1 oxidoreductase domain protein [Magnetococcus marinus MC-1]